MNEECYMYYRQKNSYDHSVAIIMDIVGAWTDKMHKQLHTSMSDDTI